VKKRRAELFSASRVPYAVPKGNANRGKVRRNWGRKKKKKKRSNNKKERGEKDSLGEKKKVA